MLLAALTAATLLPGCNDEQTPSTTAPAKGSAAIFLKNTSARSSPPALGPALDAEFEERRRHGAVERREREVADHARQP